MGIIVYKTHHDILDRADITITQPLKIEYANGFFSLDLKFMHGHKEYAVNEKIKGKKGVIYALCLHKDEILITENEKAKGIVIYRFKEERNETDKKKKD